MSEITPKYWLDEVLNRGDGDDPETLAYVLKKHPDKFPDDGLFWAVKRKCHQCLLFMLSQLHLDVHRADRDGLTPMHYACKMGDKTSIEILLSNYSCVFIKDKQGRTALDLARMMPQENFEALNYVVCSSYIMDTLHRLTKQLGIIGFSSFRLAGEFIGFYAMNPKFIARFRGRSTRHLRLMFHGTTEDRVGDVFSDMLRQPGEVTSQGTVLQVKDGHFNPDMKYDGLSEFGRAIFVSCSPGYASAYGEVVDVGEDIPCKLVIVVGVDEKVVKEGNATEHAGTTMWYKYGNEYNTSKVELRVRIPRAAWSKDEAARGMFVMGVLLIPLSLLTRAKEYYSTEIVHLIELYLLISTGMRVESPLTRSWCLAK